MPTAGPVRQILDSHAGVLRDQAGLAAAVEALTPIARGDGPDGDPGLVALFIATAALARTESRGGHCRTDFRDRAAVAERRVQRLSDVLGPTAVADAA
jgi:L-aspartate oxidase